MNPHIYLRGLRHVEHTVFCVKKQQKTYFDPIFNVEVGYASGQQVKRSALETLTTGLNVPMSPTTFNYEYTGKDFESKEPWAICDPNYIDQLIGGWMRAGGELILKRRSPLSISALRPLHPLLAGISKEDGTYDRREWPEQHPVNVRYEGKLLNETEIRELLNQYNRQLPPMSWNSDFVRTTGLFVYDVAIDLRRLFCVSVNQITPELTLEKIKELENKGWEKGENVFGKCLVLPKEQREKIIPVLANALLNWRITSNQSRTFSLMETLAIAISDDASTIASTIRSELIQRRERQSAKLVLDPERGAELYVTLPSKGTIVTDLATADALERAKQKLIDIMMAFDYQNQL